MIEAGLELTIAQIAEIPTGREPIRFGFWVALGSRIAPIELLCKSIARANRTRRLSCARLPHAADQFEPTRGRHA
jgi:hypothetical protein